MFNNYNMYNNYVLINETKFKKLKKINIINKFITYKDTIEFIIIIYYVHITF